jgi:hypothetical protein
MLTLAACLRRSNAMWNPVRGPEAPIVNSPGFVRAAARRSPACSKEKDCLRQNRGRLPEIANGFKTGQRIVGELSHMRVDDEGV